MMKVLRLLGQLVVITILFAGVAALADWPVYRQIPKDAGIIVLTFVHGADRRAECRRLTPQEIAKLPPNMRRTQECPRGRRALDLELEIDGRIVFRASLPPTGIAGDGPSKVYQRFVLPAGQHEVAVRMRDTPRTDGFDHQRRERVTLAADQLLVIDFRPEQGGFVLR